MSIDKFVEMQLGCSLLLIAGLYMLYMDHRERQCPSQWRLTALTYQWNGQTFGSIGRRYVGLMPFGLGWFFIFFWVVCAGGFTWVFIYG